MSDQKNLINWYPGHMAKTKRLLQDQIKRIDLVIEICDARVPYSSRNPDLDRMTAQKRRILFLNKSDLADPSLNQAWLQYFRCLGTEAYLTDALKMKGIGELLDGIRDLLPENGQGDGCRNPERREKHPDQQALRKIRCSDWRPARSNKEQSVGQSFALSRTSRHPRAALAQAG